MSSKMSAFNQQFDDIWKEAAEKYRDTTGKDLNDAREPHPNTIEDLMKSIELQTKEMKATRDEKQSFFKVLEYACKPIELVGNIAAGAAAAAFPPSTQCFGAVMYLITAAHGVSESYDAIASLMEMLQDFLIRLQIYNRNDLPEEMRVKLAQILAVFIDIIARATKRIDRGILDRLTSFGKNVLLGSDKNLQDLVKKLDTMTSTETKIVIAETYTETRLQGQMLKSLEESITDGRQTVDHAMKDINASLQQISLDQNAIGRQLLNEMQQTMDHVKESTDHETLDKVRDILRPSFTASSRYASIIKARAPQTGEWIVRHPVFQGWIRREDPFLWICGNPGAGKSFVAASIVSHLGQPTLFSDMAALPLLAYFFFKDNDPVTRSFHRAVKDIAYQVAEQEAVYARYIVHDVGTAEAVHDGRLAWDRLIKGYFLSGSAEHRPLYIILDGLDEAFPEEREILMDSLSDIENTRPTARGHRVSITMVGRTEITDELDMALVDRETKIPQILVNIVTNHADIERNIETSIRQSKKLKSTSTSMQREILTTILDKADGMFFWYVL